MKGVGRRADVCTVTTITPHPDAHARPSRNRPTASRPLLVGLGAAVLIGALVAAWFLRPSTPSGPSGPIVLADRDRPAGATAKLTASLTLPAAAGTAGVTVRVPAIKRTAVHGAVEGMQGQAVATTELGPTFFVTDFGAYAGTAHQHIAELATQPKSDTTLACSKVWDTMIGGLRAAATDCAVKDGSLLEYRVKRDGHVFGFGILVRDTVPTARDTGLAVLQTWEWLE